MLDVPIPRDDEQNLFELLLLHRVHVACAPCGLFAAEVHLELRYQVGKILILCVTWSVHC